MSGKPVIHQYQVSPFAAKVRRVMYYKGIDFDVVNYGLSGAGKIKKINRCFRISRIKIQRTS